MNENRLRYYDETIAFYNALTGQLYFLPKNVYVLAADGLGDSTRVAGAERRLTAHVKAEQANAARMDVPDGGCTGWLELQRAAGQAEECVGIRIEGAKPFFAGAHGMSLR